MFPLLSPGALWLSDTIPTASWPVTCPQWLDMLCPPALEPLAMAGKLCGRFSIWNQFLENTEKFQESCVELSYTPELLCQNLLPLLYHIPVYVCIYINMCVYI